MSQGQCRVVVGLLVVVHVAFAALLTPFNLPADSGPIGQRFHLTVIGALIAQPALVALWAGLAPQPFLRRWAQALAILMGVVLAAEFASVQNASAREQAGSLLQPVAWLMAVAVCQLPLLILRRRFGWQIEPPVELAHPHGAQSNQFSMRNLLGAMAVLAAFLAALRWLHPASPTTVGGLDLLRFAAMGVMTGLVGMLAIVVGWLVLPPGRGGLWRWSIGLIGALLAVIAAALVAVFGSPGEAGELVFVLLGTILSAAGSQWIVRLCGYRLVRHRAGHAPLPGETSVADPMTSPGRRFVLAILPMALVLAGLAALVPERLTLWREKQEARAWSDAGLIIVRTDGAISAVICDDGARLLADAVDRINACSPLRRLDLAGSDAGDETLERLEKLPQLTSLSLCGARVSDRGVEHLGKFRELRQLDLCLTEVTDESLVVLAGLNALSSVDLSHTRVTQEGIDWLKQTRPSLRIDSGADDTTLLQLARRFRQRRTQLSQVSAPTPAPLRFRATGPKVTDAGVAALRGMTRIERLDLTDAKVTDAAVGVLATLTGLKRLVLRGTRITESGAASLRRQLPGCEIDR